jgi:hypothetical protein
MAHCGRSRQEWARTLNTVGHDVMFEWSNSRTQC